MYLLFIMFDNNKNEYQNKNKNIDEKGEVEGKKDQGEKEGEIEEV